MLKLNALKTSWQRLSTYSGARRLSWFSMILLLALDGFVLGMLFNGMSEATRSVDIPLEPVSRGCASMTEDYLKSDAKARVASLRPYVMVSAEEQNGNVYGSGFEEHERLDVCERVRDKLKAYARIPALHDLFEQYNTEEQNIAKINEEIATLKSSYGDALLEKIARQKREDSILPADAAKVKSTLEHKDAELKAAEEALQNTQNALETHLQVNDYTNFVTGLPFANDFSKARAEYARLSFWYPVKILAVEVLFLLPLLVLAIGWNNRALKRGKDTSILISSHLILVCAVPIFVRLVYFVYELLPHSLLARLISALEELNLGFVWSYVAIAAAIAGGITLIFIAQKTYFSPERQRVLRLRKQQCRECGEKLTGADQSHCEFCGTAQLENCASCGTAHRALAFHCPHCGHEKTAA